MYYRFTCSGFVQLMVDVRKGVNETITSCIHGQHFPWKSNQQKSVERWLNSQARRELTATENGKRLSGFAAKPDKSITFTAQSLVTNATRSRFAEETRDLRLFLHLTTASTTTTNTFILHTGRSRRGRWDTRGRNDVVKLLLEIRREMEVHVLIEQAGRNGFVALFTHAVVSSRFAVRHVRFAQFGGDDPSFVFFLAIGIWSKTKVHRILINHTPQSPIIGQCP